jgi:hypothetical protein
MNTQDVLGATVHSFPQVSQAKKKQDRSLHPEKRRKIDIAIRHELKEDKKMPPASKLLDGVIAGRTPISAKMLDKYQNLVQNLVTDESLFFAEKVLPTSTRHRVSGADFGLKTPMRAPWIKHIRANLPREVKLYPAQADVIFRCKGMEDQAPHQEMGDNMDFWQVLLPLHHSSKNTTTTAIFPNGPQAPAIYPDMAPGEWVALRGNIWHAGSAVHSDPTTFIANGSQKLLPLVTFYYSTDEDNI